MKEMKLSSDVMKKILSAKTSEELITNLKSEGIVKEVKDEKLCDASEIEEENNVE